jgi:pantoate--beta-alanine ligase
MGIPEHVHLRVAVDRAVEVGEGDVQLAGPARRAEEERAAARRAKAPLAAAFDAVPGEARGRVAQLDALGVEPEYVAVVDPDSFLPITSIDGDVLVAIAARVGRARLIDNATITRTPEVATVS